ncbi:MAG: hypothetical protein R2911_01890 [Caldilineaceae bacterium]
MRTLGQICGRIAIVLLAAGIVIGGTWFAGNRFGSAMSGPPPGEFQQVDAASTTADTTGSTTETFAPPADGRPEGDHHGTASVGFALLGMGQNAAIILVIVLIVAGIEKALTWKKATVSSVV